MNKKIIKIDPKTGDFLVYSEEEYNSLVTASFSGCSAVFKGVAIKTTSNAKTFKIQAKIGEETPKTDLICPRCEREVPNKSWFRKNGCIWCKK